MKFFKKIPPTALFSVLLIILFLLHVAVLSPITFRINSDVAYENSYLPFAMETLLQLVYLAVYVVTFAYIAWATMHSGKRGLKFLGIFAASTVLRYALNIFCSYMYEGGIPSSSERILSDVRDGLLAASFDIFQAAFCLVVTLWLVSKSKRRYEAALKWAKKHGDESRAEQYNTMKWSSIFGLSNPVQLSLFLSACLIALTKIGSRMIYDISLSEMGVAPTAAEIPLMIAYYLSDLIFGLLIYLGSLAAVWFTQKDQE